MFYKPVSLNPVKQFKISKSTTPFNLLTQDWYTTYPIHQLSEINPLSMKVF